MNPTCAVIYTRIQIVKLLIRPEITLINSTYVRLESEDILHKAVLCSVDDSNYLTGTQMVLGSSKTT